MTHHHLSFDVGNGGASMVAEPCAEGWKLCLDGHSHGQASHKAVFSIGPGACEPLFWMSLHALARVLPKTDGYAAGQELGYSAHRHAFGGRGDDAVVVSQDAVRMVHPDAAGLTLQMGWELRHESYTLRKNPEMVFVIKRHMGSECDYAFEHVFNVEGACNLMRFFYGLYEDRPESCSGGMEPTGPFDKGYCYSPEGKRKRADLVKLAYTRFKSDTKG